MKRKVRGRVSGKEEACFTFRGRSLLKVGLVSFVYNLLVCFEVLLGFEGFESFTKQRKHIVLKGFGCFF